MLYNSVKGGLAISCFPKEVGRPEGSALRAPGARGSRARSSQRLDGFQGAALAWTSRLFGPGVLLQGPVGVRRRKSVPLLASGCLCSPSKTSLCAGSELASLVQWEAL